MAELRAIIDEARGDLAAAHGQPLVAEALEIARLRARARTAEEIEQLEYAVAIRTEELQGRPIGEELDPATGEVVAAYNPAAEELARRYAEIAHGRATPVDLYHEQFIAQAQNKKRTEGRR